MKVDELKPFYNKTFSIEELKNYFKQDAASIRVQLSRFCKSKKIIRLKRNLYTFPDAHPDAFMLGQQMLSPSYYSLESVLSWNGIIPEGTVAYTLVTSKNPQQFRNEFGTYVYRHLPPKLFFGVKQRKDGVWVATSEKALLDYLYLNSGKFQPNSQCWREERFDELVSLNWKQMKEWAQKYGMKKLEVLVTSLHDYTTSPDYQGHR